MTVDRRANPAIQVSDEGQPNLGCFKQVAQIVTTQRTRQQTVGDLLVVLVAVPLLVACSVLLHSCMRTDWVRNPETRWRILGLGLSLLFISLLVCMYATHRLGLCIWAAHQQSRPAPSSNRCRRRTLSSRGNLPAPLTSNDSQMHLMVSGELPPSYDSVMDFGDLPPPYCTLIVAHEKGEVTRSSAHAEAAYLGTG